MLALSVIFFLDCRPNNSDPVFPRSSLQISLKNVVKLGFGFANAINEGFPP